MRNRRTWVGGIWISIIGSFGLAQAGWCDGAPRETATVSGTVDSHGTVHIPSISVPYSEYASPQAKSAFLAYQEFITSVPELLRLPMSVQRQRMADNLRPALERERALYSVESKPSTMGGVYVDVITPEAGISARNRHRAL